MKLLTAAALALVFCSQNIMAQDNLDSRDQGRHARERALSKELKKIRGQDNQNTENNTNTADGNYYGNGYGYSYYSDLYPNRVMLQSTNLTLVSPITWFRIVEGITGDSILSFYYNLNSRIDITVDDIKMTGGGSTGHVMIFTATMGVITLPVKWRRTSETNNDFDTQILLPYSYNGVFLNVRITGHSTDNQVTAELKYGSNLVAIAEMSRLN